MGEDFHLHKKFDTPDWYNKRVPLTKDETYGNDVQTMSRIAMGKIAALRETDLSEIPQILKNAVWYQETDYGIVVADPFVEWLFAEQVDVFDLVNSNANDDFNPALPAWLSMENTDYFINNFYSYGFLRQLRLSLEDSDVERKG